MIKLNTPKNSLAKKRSPHYMPAHQAIPSLPSVISSLLWETEDLEGFDFCPHHARYSCVTLGLSSPSLSLSDLLSKGRGLIYYWHWVLFMEPFLTA